MVVTRFPTANATYSGAGFTNPNNLHGNDGVYGTSAPAKNGGLGNAYSGFGFDAQIPSGSTIDAVKVIYEFKVSGTGSVAIQRVKARIGGVEEENHDNTNEPTSDTAVTVDITADRAWVRDNLLDANFEVIAEPRRGNTNTSYTASWDYVSVEVTYTEQSSQTYPQAISVIAVGVASLSKKSTFKKSVAVTALGVVSLASKLVYKLSVAATAVGVAGVSSKLVMKVGVAATALGSVSLTTAMVLKQAISSTAVGVVSVATQFIQGSGGGRVMKFARGFIAGVGRMMGR